ncbi:MAG: hypothetical protein JWO31_3338 [Phycisphaerales bacterium]|nr:hypothetical protein [Phycisphaerales bacterium]
MVIGFGVVATLQLLAAGTVSNAAGNELTTAVQLANNVREISLGLAFYDPQSPTQWVSREATVAAYDNLLDLDGQAFDPPLNGARTPIASMATWAQKVDVQPVSETNYATAVPRTTSVRTARVTVTIEHNKKVVYQTAWIACAPNAD